MGQLNHFVKLQWLEYIPRSINTWVW